MNGVLIGLAAFLLLYGLLQQGYEEGDARNLVLLLVVNEVYKAMRRKVSA